MARWLAYDKYRHKRRFQHLKIGCLSISQKSGIFGRLGDKLKAFWCLLVSFCSIPFYFKHLNLLSIDYSKFWWYLFLHCSVCFHFQSFSKIEDFEQLYQFVKIKLVNSIFCPVFKATRLTTCLPLRSNLSYTCINFTSISRASLDRDCRKTK
jgi:hypothetical protein